MAHYLFGIHMPEGEPPPPEVAGPAAALSLVDVLDLAGHHLFHAVRADLLRRLGRATEAAQAYQAAMARTGNAAERAFLERAHASLGDP